MDLINAAGKGDVDLANILLERSDVEKNFQDEEGKTALYRASLRNHLEVVNCLLEAGADANLQDKDGWTALHWAANEGHLEVLNALLQSGADVNLSDKDGWTALHKAANKGHHDVANALLQAGADVHLQNKNGWTAFHRAAENGHLEVVNALLQAPGVTVNFQNEQGETTLHWAANKGHVEVLNALLAAGADVKLQNKKGETAFHLAANEGRLEVVNALLQLGVDVNMQNEKGETALEHAAYSGHRDVVYALLQAGADLYLQNKDGLTAFHRAAYKGHLEVLNALLRAEADVNLSDKKGETALHKAANSDHLQVVNALLQLGADVNLQNEKGETALEQAAYSGHRDVVNALLQAGADMHLQNKNGWTAFNWATEKGHLEVVKVLLQAPGVNVNFQNEQGETILHWTANKGHLEVLNALLAAGADVKLQNKKGETALHKAANGGHFQLVNALLQERSDVNVQDEEGKTALYRASLRNHLEVVNCLLEAGAGANLQDKDGWTALHWAANEGHLEVLNTLLQAGADMHLQNKNGWSAFHRAIEKGHLEVVNALLQAPGVNVNFPNEQGETTLHCAANKGHLEVLNALLQAGADGNLQNKKGETALEHAAFRGNRDVVNALLQAGADWNLQNENGWTALHWAANKGHLEVVNALVQAGADVNLQIKKGETALHKAAKEGHLQVVNALLQDGANVNLQDKDSETSLHKAAEKGHVEVVNALLQAPAINVNIPNNKGEAALEVAADKGHLEVVNALLQAGADVHQQSNNGWTAFHWAANQGRSEMVNALLQAPGVIVDKPNQNGDTALHKAAQKGRLKTVTTLLNAGADKDLQNKDGWSALHLAVDNGQLDVANALLEAGADVNLQSNKNRWATFHWAVENDNLEVVNALLQAPGLHVDTPNQKGWTALQKASMNGQLKAVTMLLNAGANGNLQQKNGWTALHWAVENGHLEVVNALLQAGADVHQQSNNGWTAFHWAAEHGRSEIVNALLQAPGVIVDKPNQNGDTALQKASMKGQLKAVDMLLNAGANGNLQNKDGWTALHWAAEKSHLEVMNALLQAPEVNVNIKNEQGQTALDLVKCKKIKKLLKRCGGKRGKCTATGTSAVPAAATIFTTVKTVPTVPTVPSRPPADSSSPSVPSRPTSALKVYLPAPVIMPCFFKQCVHELTVALGQLSTNSVFVLEMDYTAGGAVDSFSFTVPDLSGLYIDPKSGALQAGRVLVRKGTTLPAKFQAVIAAQNARGKAFVKLSIHVILLGPEIRDVLKSAYRKLVEIPGACQHVLDPSCAFLSSLPSVEMRNNMSAAIQALQQGAFDIYAGRDSRDPGSYDGMIFETTAVMMAASASKPPDTGAALSPEDAYTVATAKLLHALACLQTYQSEGLTDFIDEATALIVEYQEMLHGGDDSGALNRCHWEPLLLLALARVIRCAQEAKVPTPFCRSDPQTSLALQSQLLAVFQHHTDGWMTADDLQAFVAVTASSSAGGEKAGGKNPHSGALAHSRSSGDDKGEQKEGLSGAELEWREILKNGNLAGDHQKLTATFKELFDMVGLQAVKTQAISVYRKVAMDLKLPASVRIGCTLNFSFMGNPGTGKTTVARIFGKLFHAMGARKSDTFIELKAQLALTQGEEAFSELIYFILHPQEALVHLPSQQAAPGNSNRNSSPTSSLSPAQKKALTLLQKSLGGRPLSAFPGGVLFVDEAHMLDPAKNSVGCAIVNAILAAAEDHRDVLTIILAGYQKDIEQKLYAFDVGMKSRFTDVRFCDYDFHELRLIWKRLLEKYSDAQSGVHWTCADLTTDIAVRRVARSIGRPGFGNGRDLRNAFERAASVAQSRKNFNPARPEVVVEDVMGPPPNADQIPELRAALHDLNQLEGLKEVKKAVKQLVDINTKNYYIEIKGEKIIENKKNRIFWGNPGTGKSTCAEIYGRILKALGLLSDGEVVLRTASDFIGSFAGETENKTSAIINLCQGKVLVIDECYNLDDNMYGKKVLDILVEKVSGQASEDIAVLLAGYEEPIRQMLRNQNPGLSSRFDPATAFLFADYSDKSLRCILQKKVAQAGLLMHPKVHNAALKKLAEKRALTRFGNAREVDNLISLAQSRASSRLLLPDQTKVRIELEDVCPPEVEAREKDSAMKALDSLYNIEGIRSKLEKLRREVIIAQNEGRPKPKLDHLLFLGNSGTGKTTVARVVAQLLSAPPLQLLPRNHVHMTKGTELKGAYVGKAQENMRAAMDAAKGGILFIDEAYALGESVYGKEALQELLTLTDDNPLYAGTVVILAGYEENIHAMLNTNQGLKSRFSKVWHFSDWTAEDCAGFCVKQAIKDGIVLEENGPAYQELLSGFQDLMTFAEEDPLTGAAVMQPRPGWANARDVSSVYKDMISERSDRVFECGGREAVPSFTAEDAQAAIKNLLQHRPAGQSRSATIRAEAQKHLSSVVPENALEMNIPTFPPQTPVRMVRSMRQAQVETPEVPPASEGTGAEAPTTAAIEANVMEAEWKALDEAQKAARQAQCERETQELLEAALRAAEVAENARLALLEEQRREREERDERDRLAREEEERRRISALEKAAAEKLRAKQAAEEAHRQEAARREVEAEQRRLEEVASEQRVQQRIRQLGKCPMCYPWIKDPSGGYVCAGGTHRISEAQASEL